MRHEALISQLGTFPALFVPSILEWSLENARWRPDPGAWSVTEVVGHMLESEVGDFRPRLKLTLSDPTATWTPIDPEGVVHERRFQDENVHDQARKWSTERAQSLAWLRTLTADSPWDNTHVHESLGDLRAGDLLAAWTAHDALHLRQLARRRFQLTERNAEGYSSEYAGRWPG